MKHHEVEKVAMFEDRKASNHFSEEDVKNLALMDVPQPIHVLEGRSSASGNQERETRDAQPAISTPSPDSEEPANPNIGDVPHNSQS